MNLMERVQKLVVQQMDRDPVEISAETSFADDLDADSLDLVELVMAFEEEFDIEIPDEVAEKFTTVQQVVDYLESAEGVE